MFKVVADSTSEKQLGYFIYKDGLFEQNLKKRRRNEKKKTKTKRKVETFIIVIFKFAL